MSTYRCPLHPEIHDDHPGTCSRCGTRLERREELQSTTGTKKKRNEPIRVK